MLWIILALGSALTRAIGETFSKKALYVEHSVGYSTARSFLVFIMSLFLVWKMDLNLSFKTYLIIYVLSLLSTLAIVYSTKSLKHLDFSVYGPLYNLSPIFLLVIAYLFIGETLTIFNLAGISFLVIGSYILESGSNKKDIFKPIKIFIKSNYIHFLILALVLFSVIAVIEKNLINANMNPLTLLFLEWGFISLNFFLYDVLKYGFKEFKENFLKDKKDLFFSSFFFFLSNLFYVLALPLQNITLIIPIRRTSSLFETIIGGEFFHEKGIRYKIIACIVMIFGAVLIII